MILHRICNRKFTGSSYKKMGEGWREREFQCTLYANIIWIAKTIVINKNSNIKTLKLKNPNPKPLNQMSYTKF